MKPVCSYLWKHACVRPGGEVQPCCHFDSSSITLPRLEAGQNLSQVMNGAFYRDMRTKALAGAEIPGCHKCDIPESLGQASLREMANATYPLTGSETIASHISDVQYLEIFVGDVCNLKCVMCGPDLSTAWRGDYQKLGWPMPSYSRPRVDLRNAIENLNSLREIKFVGGEPLLSREHEELLLSIPEESSRAMTLTYYSNGTVLPSPSVREAWTRFKQIDLWLSIDGVGQLNDYIRYPSHWPDVERNIGEYRRMGLPLTLGVHCTVSWYNVFSLAALEAWWESVAPRQRLVFYNLVDPAFMRIENLPNRLKDLAISRLNPNSHLQRRIGELIKLPGHDVMHEFLRYSSALDQLRGNRLIDVVPELG